MHIHLKHVIAVVAWQGQQLCQFINPSIKNAIIQFTSIVDLSPY